MPTDEVIVPQEHAATAQYLLQVAWTVCEGDNAKVVEHLRSTAVALGYAIRTAERSVAREKMLGTRRG